MRRIWAIEPGPMRATLNLWLMVPERNIPYLRYHYRMMRRYGLTEEEARYFLTDLLFMGLTMKYCPNFGRLRHET